MFGFIMKRIKDAYSKGYDEGIEIGFRLGFGMGQMSAKDQEYMELFHIPSLVEKQAEIILEQKRKDNDGNYKGT